MSPPTAIWQGASKLAIGLRIERERGKCVWFGEQDALQTKRQEEDQARHASPRVLPSAPPLLSSDDCTHLTRDGDLPVILEPNRRS